MKHLLKLLSIVLMIVCFSSCDNKDEEVNILTSTTWTFIDEDSQILEYAGLKFGGSQVTSIYRFFNVDFEIDSYTEVFDYTIDGNTIKMIDGDDIAEGELVGNKLFVDYYGEVLEYRPMEWNLLMSNIWVAKKGTADVELIFTEDKIGKSFYYEDSYEGVIGTYTFRGSDIFANIEGEELKGSILKDNVIVFDGLKFEPKKQ